MTLLQALLEFLIEVAVGQFDDVLTDAAGILSLGSGNWDKMLVFTNILKPFCYTIMGFCLLIEMYQILMRFDNFKWEFVVRIGFKIVLTKVFIDIAPTFLKACFVQALSWIQKFSTVDVVGTESRRSMAYEAARYLDLTLQAFEDTIGIYFWGTFLVVLILVLLIWCCTLVIKAIAFGRIIEIYVWLAISPIPLSFMPLGHGDGGGISPITGGFIKAFIASCLQGLVIVIDLQVFNLLLNEILRDAPIELGFEIIGYLCAILLAAITLIIVVVKSGSMAKRLIGAM